MNSFQHKVKQKMNAEISPGIASGSTILIRICQRLAPSISAHSSSSNGMVLKHPINSQVENGIKMVGYVRISAIGESNKPYWNTTAATGMNRREGGTREA